MKKFSTKITGDFSFDLSKYPMLKKSSVAASVQDFIKSQYPSNFTKEGDATIFKNKLFRFKVSRSRNNIRAFNKGELKVTTDSKTLKIAYSGTLYRGVAIAALQTLVVSAVIAYSSPSTFYLAPLFFLFAYTLQVNLSHTVFPMALGKWLHEHLTKMADENN